MAPESPPKSKRTFKEFVSKFFMEGQTTSAELDARKRRVESGAGILKDENSSSDSDGQLFDEEDQERSAPSNKRRLIWGMLIPVFIVHTIWWTYMGVEDRFHLFEGRSGGNGVPRWYMSITMVFGSMLAGATSEGGAAVAFPVMTLAFAILPVVARDFSFMIQSVGMTAAAGCILWMGVLVEKKAVLYVTLGGVGGIIYGLEKVAPTLTPPYAKMYFVVIWGSFAASLYWLNRIRKRRVYLVLDPPFFPRIWSDATFFRLGFISFNWKACILVATGFLGGIFSAISGSGIDICSFAVLTLFFRISEKTATPTSVILMAINTVTGFLYREYGMGGVEHDAWGFFLVCVPIVCIGAPLGSVLGSHVHRLVLAWAVYVTDFVQLVGALVIVKPWTDAKTDTPVHLTASSAAIFVSGIIAFYLLQYGGEKLVAKNEQIEQEAKDEHKRLKDDVSRGATEPVVTEAELIEMHSNL